MDSQRLNEHLVPPIGFGPDQPTSAAPLATAQPDPVPLLEARARRLAQAATEMDSSAAVDMLIVRLREEQYAVELCRLRALQWARDLTPVPCTPAAIAGMLNVRGEIVTVLDLGTVVGLSGTAAVTDAARVLLAEVPQGQVGLLVDAVLGIRRLALDALDQSLSGSDRVHGVAAAQIVVLNLERLLDGGQFDAYEDVNA